MKGTVTHEHHREEPPWAALRGSCPCCGHLLAHIEGSAMCLSCGFEQQPTGETATPDKKGAQKNE